MHFFNLDLTYISDEIDVVPFSAFPHFPLGPVASYRLVRGKGGLKIRLVNEHARPVSVNLLLAITYYTFLVPVKNVP